MTDLTITGLALALSQALSILEAHSDKLAELERREQQVLAGLNLIFDSARYSDFFQTEGQALIAFNLMQKARYGEWVPVDRLPRYLVEGRSKSEVFNPDEHSQ